MLKLIQCEFGKLKRKHFVSFVIFAALLFPIPFTALVLAGSVGNFTGFDAVLGMYFKQQFTSYRIGDTIHKFISHRFPPCLTI